MENPPFVIYILPGQPHVYATGGNFFIVVFITERQTFTSFYDNILKKDFVSLPGDFWEAVYCSVSELLASTHSTLQGSIKPSAVVSGANHRGSIWLLNELSVFYESLTVGESTASGKAVPPSQDPSPLQFRAHHPFSSLHETGILSAALRAFLDKRSIMGREGKQRWISSHLQNLSSLGTGR